MKWSSTVAALMVLTVSASVRADEFGQFPRIGQDETSAEGPAFVAPEQPQYSASVMRAHPEQPLEAIAPPVHMSGYSGGAMSTADFGFRGMAVGGSCCQERRHQADTLWNDYCQEQHKCKWPHGWLAGRLGCGCRTMSSPCPMFGGFKSAADCGCRQPAHSACAEPACERCGSNPCGCRKSGGLLMALFASFQRKHDCGCNPAPGCSEHTDGHNWSESYQGEEVYSDEAIEPALPPAPIPPANETGDAAGAAEPQSIPQPPSAQRGLLPAGFRLFPNFGG